MTDFSQIDYKDAVRAVVRRRLKETGIKVPKFKPRSYCKIDHGSYDNPNTVFGIPLDRQPTQNIGCNYYIPVPRFLVYTTGCLENHLGSEGLFRKSGSSVRQRGLRKTLEDGGDISNAAQPHDVASLLKQFFRELPEPLLTNQLHEYFLKCLLLTSRNEQTMAILLLCILLPLEHLYTLQYFVRFISKVAKRSEESKMGVANLAIVLAPTLMNSNSKKENNNSEKLLKEQTMVVQILFESASKIGLVSEDILCQVQDNYINAGGLSSGDELDGEKIGLRGRSRPTSISGFVSGFGNKVNKFCHSSNHRRSKSVKAEFSRQKQKVEVNIKAKDDCTLFAKHLVNSAELSGVIKDHKRKTSEREVDQDLSPVGKRKMTSKEPQSKAQCHVISSPFSVTGSTQMFTTPKRPIPRTRPLSEIVSHTQKKNYSHETQHVKVVDTRHYESPEPLRPGAITLEFTKLMSQTPVGEKYVFDSPQSATLSCEMKSKRAKRQGRNRANRRNSSGATRCFSSSPRSRNKLSKKNTPNKSTLASENKHEANASSTDERCNLITGNSWLKNPEKNTPRRNTPPLPHLKKKPEFQTIFTQNVF